MTVARLGLILLGGLTLAGCKTRFPLYCETSADCADPDRPHCDLTGDISGEGGHICVADLTDGGTEPDGATTAPDVPEPLSPPNGAYTGSKHADSARRPQFRWRAAPGAERYEIEIDDSCAIPDFDDCTFASPEIRETNVTALAYRPPSHLPVQLPSPGGRRYFWRVRACNVLGCSPWSATRYLNVGRLADDFNGDGYSELVAGMVPDELVGVAYAFRGRSGGMPSTLDAAEYTIDDPKAIVEGGFGSEVTPLGDVDGDGFADLLVGAERHDGCGSGAGAAFLFFGDNSATFETHTEFVHPEADGGFDPCPERFGLSATGIGDINGDGLSDVLVAAQDRPLPAGIQVARVYVYLGRSTWPTTLATPDIILTDPLGQVGSSFGLSLSTAGDLDADGFVDIVVGSPLASRPEDREGQVYLYRGRADWGTLPITIEDADVIVDNPADETLAFFGGLCTGDVNDDGRADLVVGAPQRASPESLEGGGFIFFGMDELPPTLEAADVTIDNPDDQESGQIGGPLDCGFDVNGDGIDDLLVGSLGRDVPSHSYLLFGRPSWPVVVDSADVLFSDPLSTGNTEFGHRVSALGDFDGNGIRDVAISAPSTSNPEAAEGSVFIWAGRMTWPAELDVADSVVDNPADLADSRFGDAMR